MAGGKHHTTHMDCEWWAGGSPGENQGLLSEEGTREEKLAEMTEAHHTIPVLTVQGYGFAVL